MFFLDHMDTSNFPESNPCRSLKNDRKLGFMKDECAGVQPVEFVGLRSKMYSLLLPDSHKSTAKGIQNSFQRENITHDTFVECLNSKIKTSAQFCSLRSNIHVITTQTIIKYGLNPYDDKRYILPDGHGTLSYGHYKIPPNHSTNTGKW